MPVGNVAVFDTENRMPADKICFALNQRLPEDIRVQSSEEVPADWHPRKANCTKTYEYKVLNRKISMPLERLYAHFCYFNLDLDKMREAAAYLVGEHDFKSFCTVRTQAEETVRTIYSLDITKQDDMITIRISGSGFLYNMVRIIAGTLLEVGMGAYPPEHMEEILDARDRQAAGRTAPARGLTLVEHGVSEGTAGLASPGESNTGSMTFCSPILKPNKTAYFVITRCADEELDGILRRNIHHAFQNGAERVYVTDLEQPERLRPVMCMAGMCSGEQIDSEENWFGAEEREKLKQLENSAEAVGRAGQRPEKPVLKQPVLVQIHSRKRFCRWVTALPACG